MSPLISVRRSSIQGCGVYVDDAVIRGSTVLTIDDSHTLDDAEDASPDQRLYLDFLAGGRVVVMQSPERYINHSCDPNAFVRTIGGVRKVLARRDLMADEEITYDYSVNGSGETVWLCSCGSERCRRTVHSNFFELPLPLQKLYLHELDEWFVEENSERIAHLQQLISN